MFKALSALAITAGVLLTSTAFDAGNSSAEAYIRKHCYYPVPTTQVCKTIFVPGPYRPQSAR